MCGGSIGRILRVAAPIAGAIFAPELAPAWMGSSVASGLGAAAGGLASGAGLKGAAEEGLLAGGGTALAGALSGPAASGAGGASGASPSFSSAPVGSPASDALVGNFAGAPAAAGSLSGAALGSPASDVLLPGEVSPAAQSIAASFPSGIPYSSLGTSWVPSLGSSGGGSLVSRALSAPLPGPSALESSSTGSGQGGYLGSGITAPSAPAGVTPSAPVPSAAGGTSGGSTGGSGGFLDNVWNEVKKNPALALSLGGLATSAMMQPKIPNLEGVPGMTQNAGLASSAAASLVPSMQTGVLPPGEQNMVSRALQDNQNSIRAKYAQMGMSGSSSETQELEAAQQNAQAMSAQLASEATKTGLSALGTSQSIYDELAKLNLSSDQALQNALANFAASSAGGYGLGKAIGG